MCTSIYCKLLSFDVQATCVDISLAILYIILVSLFFGWGFLHRTRERNAAQRKPLSNIDDGNRLHGMETQKNEDLPMEVWVSAS